MKAEFISVLLFYHDLKSNYLTHKIISCNSGQAVVVPNMPRTIHFPIRKQHSLDSDCASLIGQRHREWEEGPLKTK